MPLTLMARLRELWPTQASWSSGEVSEALGVSMPRAYGLIAALKYQGAVIEKIPATETRDARYRIQWPFTRG